MAAGTAALNVGSLFLGICIPSLKINASRFKVQHLLYDKFLKKHFTHSFELFAYDPDKICKSGDIALIQELPNSISKSVKHKVVNVVYFFGDITDPITGQKVSSGKLREDLETINSFYGGKVNSTFDYYKAPPRGWQEGKRDFTNRETYFKYHEFDDDDENKDQPYGM